jgi:hypothetical protein
MEYELEMNLIRDQQQSRGKRDSSDPILAAISSAFSASLGLLNYHKSQACMVLEENSA